jgi:hypothetical protein|tara:strand:- start:127 stop:327 length:201 start_codon:yes stop_codon:yes gene_type:complete
MEKKIQTQLETQIEWLNNELEKDKIEVERNKSKFINQIKQLKKEDIVKVNVEKMTLWKRIKKVLLG